MILYSLNLYALLENTAKYVCVYVQMKLHLMRTLTINMLEITEAGRFGADVISVFCLFPSPVLLGL